MLAMFQELQGKFAHMCRKQATIKSTRTNLKKNQIKLLEIKL